MYYLILKMNNLFGNQLINHGTKLPLDILNDIKVIGIYFSGSYCPPCQKFTPILSDIYNKLKELNKSIEIIFISSDKEIESFNSYYAKMPWLTIPYENRNQKNKLCEMFGVKTIPQLIFITNELDILDEPDRYFIENNKDNLELIISKLNI